MNGSLDPVWTSWPAWTPNKSFPRPIHLPHRVAAARAMGNTLHDQFIPELAKAFQENEDERVLGMIAWALGRIGGLQAKQTLSNALSRHEGLVKEEISAALGKC